VNKHITIFQGCQLDHKTVRPRPRLRSRPV